MSARTIRTSKEYGGYSITRDMVDARGFYTVHHAALGAIPLGFCGKAATYQLIPRLVAVLVSGRGKTSTPQPVPAFDPNGFPVTQTVLVDELTAARWLTTNLKNREIKTGRVFQYSAALVAGDWKDTNDSLAIDESGHFMNGQHRLWAIVYSGVPAWLRITAGMSRDAMSSMDNAPPREPREHIALDGGAMAKHKQMVINSLCRFVGSARRADTSYKVRLAKAWARDIEAVCAAANNEVKRGDWLAGLVLAHRLMPETTISLIDEIVGLKFETPIAKGLYRSIKSEKAKGTRPVIARVVRCAEIYAECSNSERVSVTDALIDRVVSLAKEELEGP